ncbi:MAG: hydrogenase subunit MbhD domain-containing protein [Halomonas sp.]|uniref:Na(+)/H(+) antiporter subunit B n=1 Tax=Halomonas sp. TaxID=1486246 RepID=UPI002ACE4BE4|nr:hydrogenase subunit MbhD domain-containing protein [Halomonas sp.]MDZ7852061.1 hydrogenase subunit MbhD domain-containing protein [Halomonas sp.]
MSLSGELFPASLLVILAAACLLDRHLLRACLAFIAFALLMSLAWWWLDAPLLALVEAVLGALLTGFALFHGLGRPGSPSSLPLRDQQRRPRHQAPVRWLAAFVWLTLAGVAVWGISGDGELVASDEATRRPLLATGLVIMALGLWAFAYHLHLLRRLLAFNVLGSGVFLLLAGLAGPGGEVQGLILVGLVVALIGSVLGAALLRRLYALDGRVTLGAEAAD